MPGNDPPYILEQNEEMHRVSAGRKIPIVPDEKSPIS
jgi:hypothetical protein